MVTRSIDKYTAFNNRYSWSNSIFRQRVSIQSCSLTCSFPPNHSNRHRLTSQSFLINGLLHFLAHRHISQNRAQSWHIWIRAQIRYINSSINITRSASYIFILATVMERCAVPLTMPSYIHLCLLSTKHYLICGGPKR